MHVTPCECEGPGWCERHQCYKPPHWFQMCRRRQDYFQAWERGQGPRREKAAMPAVLMTVPCKHRGDVLREEECPACRGRVRVKIFDCRKHGGCTVARPIREIACCVTCEDYASVRSSDHER